MNLKSDLKLDWVGKDAARYAVVNWHYTRSYPSVSCRVGVWNAGAFVGDLCYGYGAGASTDGRQYGLKRTREVAELVRVAFKPDHGVPVSRCLSIATKMVAKLNPKLRMIISFADQAQGHHGGIYQAAGWIYAGETEADRSFIIHGRVLHPKTVHSKGWVQSEKWLREHIDSNARCEKSIPKHRYLMPLDGEIHKIVEPMALPYPKRAKQAMEVPPSQRRCGTDPRAPLLLMGDDARLTHRRRDAVSR